MGTSIRPRPRRSTRPRLQGKLDTSNLSRTDHFQAVLQGGLLAVSAAASQHDPNIASPSRRWSATRYAIIADQTTDLWRRVAKAIQHPRKAELEALFEEINDLWADVNAGPTYATVAVIIDTLRSTPP